MCMRMSCLQRLHTYTGRGSKAVPHMNDISLSQQANMNLIHGILYSSGVFKGAKGPEFHACRRRRYHCPELKSICGTVEAVGPL